MPPQLPSNPPTIPKARTPFLTAGFTQELELVKTRYKASQDAVQRDLTRFARYNDLYRGRPSQKNYQGLANLFIPEPYRIVRKKTAKLSNAVREIKGKPEGPSDIQAAKIAGQILNFIRKKLDWPVIERAGIRESRIVGLAWWKMLWNLDKEEEGRPYKGFDFSFEKTDKIFIEPGKTILDVLAGNVRWIIHEYEADLETLKKNKNYSAQALETLRLRGGNTKYDASPLEQSRQMFQSTTQQKDNQTKKFNILEYWGKYIPIEENEDQDYVIVIADKTVVLRSEKNPYAEILDNPLGMFTPVLGDLDGAEIFPIGDIEPGESLFNEMNDTRNQRMDTVTLNIDPPKIKLKAANIRDEDLIARRGWVIESNIPNGLQFLYPSLEGVRAAIEEEKAIRGDIQQYSGVLDFAPGTNVQAGVEIDTARGAIIAKGEADVVTEDELNLLKLSLRMLYRTALVYAQTFLDRNFTIAVTEEGVEQFYDTNREQIRGNINVDIEMRTLQDKTTEQQMSLLLFNQAKTVPGANVGKFFTEMLAAFKESVKLEEYYQAPQAIPESPKMSVSLRGELNQMQAAQIYAQIPGVDKTFGDPAFTQEGRQIMRGQLPEHTETRKQDITQAQAIKEFEAPLQAPPNAL